MYEEHIDEYLSTLSEQEKKVLEIAIEHLGSSFDIVKSIGFLNWYDNQKK
jgi:transcriptional regulator CtsR